MDVTITAADISAGPLAGTTHPVWAVPSGRRHVEGCGRLSRSVRNVVGSLTFPPDATLADVEALLPAGCGICLARHPYLREARRFLQRAQFTERALRTLRRELHLRTYAAELRSLDRWRLDTVSPPLRPIAERLVAAERDVVNLYADAVRSPSARAEVVGELLAPNRPDLAADRERLLGSVEAGQWSLLLLTEDIASQPWWLLAQAQYWGQCGAGTGR
ncbi:hypothetical protein [Kutzneria sp. CA-103260]|uniref:hypothetical protein n=1 Tax=Kutzneria sp. CA-103260 TaxID=2802641 RepID=UPI001BAD579D|nr:hypothetical protein [Kutzneria sp. CA-103260]QUQ68310.1 hypothetical protein JJ691_60550 [Kutzneria sp. CA-103260]